MVKSKTTINSSLRSSGKLLSHNCPITLFTDDLIIIAYLPTLNEKQEPIIKQTSLLNSQSL